MLPSGGHFGKEMLKKKIQLLYPSIVIHHFLYKRTFFITASVLRFYEIYFERNYIIKLFIDKVLFIFLEIYTFDVEYKSPYITRFHPTSNVLGANTPTNKMSHYSISLYAVEDKRML